MTAWADTYTYTFTGNPGFSSTSSKIELTSTEGASATWTFSNPNGYTLANDSKGFKMGTNESANGTIYTLSTSDISGTISKITIVCCVNSNKSATVTTNVGGNALGESQGISGNSLTTLSYEGTGSGEIEIQIELTSKTAVYINSITVEYTPTATNTFAFSAESYTATYGAADNDFPTLTNTTEDKDVEYSSLVEDVAMVDTDGSIYLFGVGTTTITAKAGTYSASYELTVTKGTFTPSFSETTVNVLPSATSITVPELTGIPTDYDGTIAYSSSDTELATVDANGAVTLVGTGTGTATITVALEGSSLYNDAAATYTLNVQNSFEYVDTLTYTSLGFTSKDTYYTSFSVTSGMPSGVSYQGKIAPAGYMQMRSSTDNNHYTGIVSTSNASGMKVKKVEVVWNAYNASGTLDVYGHTSNYSGTDAEALYSSSSDTQGTYLGSISKIDSQVLEITGDYTAIGFRSNSGTLYIDKIIITWDGVLITKEDLGLSFDKAEVEVSVDDVVYEHSLSCSDLDSSDKTLFTWSSTKEEVAEAVYDGVYLYRGGNTTITVKFLGNDTYAPAEASYTLKVTDANKNDGSFARPYTPLDLYCYDITSGTCWVQGKLIGNAVNSETGYAATVTENSNVALADGSITDAADYSKNNVIGISLPTGGFRTVTNLVDNSSNVGKTVVFYGNLGSNFGRTGITSSNSMKVSGLGTLSVRTAEGYATFASDCAFEVPEGVQCGIIPTVSGNTLTINYDYTAGKTVPASTPVLVKANGINTFDIVYTASASAAPNGNLLKAGTGGAPTDEGCLFYKLAYKVFTENERSGLGFYWGADNGAAFTVPKGNAYLAVPTSTSASAMGFSFSDAVTGIESAVTGNGANGNQRVYSLDGRRVNPAAMTRGIYIVNGKKVIVK